jgi:hypothetical protein
MFIIHLFSLVLGDLFVCRNYRKFVQNGEENGQKRQVDVAGGLGPAWWRRPTPQGHRPVPHLPLPHHWSTPSAANTLPSFVHRWFHAGSRWRAEKEHHADCWRVMATKPTWQTSTSTHTHSWHVGQASRRQREVPPIIGAGRRHPYVVWRPSVLHRHLHASMQRSTCSNDLYPWLYDGLTQWRRMESTQTNDKVLE